jgi:hypothetical protein
MAEQPFPITAQNASELIQQTTLLMEELFQERVGGANLGDVFTIGDDDILTLTLSSTGGLEKSSSAVQIKAHATGGMEIGANGLAITVYSTGGLETDANGLAIKVKATGGAQTDSDGLAIKVKATGGTQTDGDGLSLKLKSGGGLIADADGVRAEALQFDGTSKTVFRFCKLTVEDGTNATTIKCTVTADANGDSVGAQDNMGKPYSSTDYSLDVNGQALTIEAAALSGNVIGALGTIVSNDTTVAYIAYAYATGNDIVVKAYSHSSGTALDWTTILDAGGGGKSIDVHILYITDA